MTGRGTPFEKSVWTHATRSETVPLVNRHRLPLETGWGTHPKVDATRAVVVEVVRALPASTMAGSEPSLYWEGLAPPIEDPFAPA